MIIVRIIVHILKASGVGLALGIFIIALFLLIAKLCNVFFDANAVFVCIFELIQWPITLLYWLDKKYCWGLSRNQDPMLYFSFMALYWIAVGQIVYWLYRLLKAARKPDVLK